MKNFRTSHGSSSSAEPNPEELMELRILRPFEGFTILQVILVSDQFLTKMACGSGFHCGSAGPSLLRVVLAGPDMV